MKRRCFLCAVLSTLATAAFGRPGNWTHKVQVPPGWWESLTNKRGGSCCANADGLKVDDPNWRITNDENFPFEVFLEGKWFPVFKDAVVDASNKVGFAVVWPMKQNDETLVRCFMPGIQA